MRITYDPRYNIAYIAMRDKTEPVTTVSVSDELNVDVAEDGRIYGIELLNANEQLAADQLDGIVVENRQTGATERIGLAP